MKRMKEVANGAEAGERLRGVAPSDRPRRSDIMMKRMERVWNFY